MVAVTIEALKPHIESDEKYTYDQKRKLLSVEDSIPDQPDNTPFKNINIFTNKSELKTSFYGKSSFLYNEKIRKIQYQIEGLISPQFNVEERDRLIQLFAKEPLLHQSCLNIILHLMKTMKEDEKIILTPYEDDDFELSERVQITYRKRKFDNEFFKQVFNLPQTFAEDIKNSKNRILIITDGLW